MAKQSKKKEAPKSHSRFTEAESRRNSEIQSLAIKYYADNDDWISCVGRARREIDGAQD
jgi:hypothetical protein